MKRPSADDNGSQPRSFVLEQLQYYGLGVCQMMDDWYEICDQDGDCAALYLPDPIPYGQVVHLWRRFGARAGMLIVDFVDRSRLN